MADAFVAINAGFSGNNSRDLLAKLQEAVLVHSPKLVVVMVGTNDMLNSGNSASIEEYRHNLELLAQRITSAGSKLLLMTILPCHDPYVIVRHKKGFFDEQLPSQRVAAGVSVIREVAAQFALPVADLNTLFSQVGHIGAAPESLLRNDANCGDADGVHPTPEGYRLIALAVQQAIINHNLPRDGIVCFGDSITFGAFVKGEGTTDGETYPAMLKMLLNCKHTCKLG